MYKTPGISRWSHMEHLPGAPPMLFFESVETPDEDRAAVTWATNRGDKFKTLKEQKKR